MIRWLTLLLLLLAATAQETTQKMANVTVYQTSEGFFGFVAHGDGYNPKQSVGMNVWIGEGDHRFVKSDKNSAVTFEIAPGAHTLWIYKDKPQYQTTLDLKPGQHYYLRLDVHPCWTKNCHWTLVETPHEEAMQTIKELPQYGSSIE